MTIFKMPLHWILAGILLLTSFYFFYMMLWAPSDDLLSSKALANHDQKNYSSLESQFLEDIGRSEKGEASITYGKADFYSIGLREKGSAGGVEAITYLKPDGHFVLLWQGQDFPPCENLNSPDYKVPAGIAPYCFQGNTVINRTNIVRVMYTSLFNPYVQEGIVNMTTWFDN